jgi:hypothetical protein
MILPSVSVKVPFFGFRCQVSGVRKKNPRKSEPQPATISAVSNIEQAISNDEVWNRCAQFFFKNNNDRIPYFDIRYSLFHSFFSD